MANPNKGYMQRQHLYVSSAKPTFRNYISALAEWAKGCSTSCKECGKEITNPTTEIQDNSVTATYTCKCGNMVTRIATESEIRRRYAEV